jgi:hypothetical protein
MSFLANRNALFSNDSGSDLSNLLLKVYTNSIVQSSRQQPSLFANDYGIVERRSSGPGKSWQWIVRGPLEDPIEYTPGEAMVGQKQVFDEVTGTVDTYLRVENFIGEDQLDASHFDVVAGMGEEHYRKFSNVYDGRIYRSLGLGARAGSRTKNGLTIHNGGNVVVQTAATVAAAFPESPLGAQNVRSAIRTMYRRLREDNINPDNYMVIPTNYIESVLKWDGAYITGTLGNTATAAGSTLFSKDYQSGNDLHQAKFSMIEGFKMLPGQNVSSNGGPIPDQNFTAANEAISKFRGDFREGGAGIGAPVLFFVGRDTPGTYGVGVLERRPIEPYMFYDKDLRGWKIGAVAEIGINRIHDWCSATVEVRAS